jgi:M6 family metalloprotease-like protein
MFLISFLACSCSFLDFFSPNLNNSDDFTFPEEESESIPSDAGYYRADFTKYTTHDLGQKSYYGAHTLKPVGRQKVLVVPVIIKGYESNATEANRSRIEKAFFGKSSETGWESVSSYFYKSSRGYLEISGVVTPWYTSGLTPSALVNLSYNGADDGGTIEMCDRVVNFAIQQGYKMTDFDNDQDGFIDAIYMIYSCPNSQNKDYKNKTINDTMWAFTYWDYSNINNANTRKPVPNTYAWSSYDFMNEGESVGISIDAHTYIHEFGHVLGLQDYYDYDGKHFPMGCVDMQDYNVGDHNAFSKFTLGWTRPYVVTDDCTITIKPATTHGHSIIIRNPNYSWNNSAFDEYLILELLTPDVLWEQDSTYKYPKFNNRTFQSPGVRLMHADGRLKTNQGNIVTTMTGNVLYYEAYSNTPSSSHDEGTSSLRADLLALIPADNNTKYQRSRIITTSPAVAGDSVLFKTGSKFDMDTYSAFFEDGVLHDGTTIPFEITFESVSATSATIRFERV